MHINNPTNSVYTWKKVKYYVILYYHQYVTTSTTGIKTGTSVCVCVYVCVSVSGSVSVSVSVCVCVCVITLVRYTFYMIKTMQIIPSLTLYNFS